MPDAGKGRGGGVSKQMGINHGKGCISTVDFILLRQSEQGKNPCFP